jgi:hypothetical protein
MLRWIVVLLIAANALAWAWRGGHLQALGLGSTTTRESERLNQQVRPDAIRILASGEAQRLERAARDAPPAQCFESSVLSDAQSAEVRNFMTELQWPAAWSVDTADAPGQWLVYMGPYDTTALSKKKDELRGINVAFEPVSAPNLASGLSLGAASSPAGAQAKLAELAKRGIRTARVVQAAAPVTGQRLRLNAVDEALRERLDSVRVRLPAGATLELCAAKP